MLLAELAAQQKAAGQSLHEKLDALYWQYGYHAESQVSVMLPGSEGMGQMAALMAGSGRTRRACWPACKSSAVRDYLALTQFAPGAPPRPLDGTAGGHGHARPGPAKARYVAVRPSGTEPKVKFYMFTYEAAEQTRRSRRRPRRMQTRGSSRWHAI